MTFPKVSIPFMLLAAIIAANSAFSQEPFKDVQIASPNAASLGKFVDVPVSMHTGIPQISIPIYQFKSGTLSLPVSLDYHAGGLKVQEYSSWVGAGWALQAGGMITRTVRGGWADEKSTYNSNHDLIHEGGYEYFAFKVLLGAYNPDYEDGVVCGRSDVKAFSPNSSEDYEPDIFFFNFLGYSGKFFIGKNYSVMTVPNTSLHIKILFDDDYPEMISRWVITDQKGIKYYFGKTPDEDDVDPIELVDTYTRSSGYDLAGDAVSGWYLYKVESANGDVINLSYEQEYYSTYSLSLLSKAHIAYTPIDQISITKVGTRGVRLSKISSASAEINFIEDTEPRLDLMRGSINPGIDALQDFSNAHPIPGYEDLTARTLKRIEISNNQSFCKGYEFNYDYWYDDSTPLRGVLAANTDFGNGMGQAETDKYRLVLQSLQEMSCDGNTEIPPYTFSYYNEDMIPRKLSFALDHWGFYNGATDNEHLSPKISKDAGASYFNPNPNRAEAAGRDSHWPYMRAGTLKLIKYPTGGSTYYQFGHHELKNCEYTMGSELNSLTMGFHQSEGWSDVMEHASNSGRIYFEIINIGSGVGKVKINGRTYSESGFADVSLGTVAYQAYLDPASIDDTGDGVRFVFYESEYTDCDAPLQVVGGLRIEKIIQDDGVDTNPPIVTTYEYKDDLGEPTGFLFSQPDYISVIRNQEMIYSFFGSIPYPDFWTLEGCGAYDYHDENTSYYTAQGPQSVHPLRSTQGSHFGYGYVRKNYLGGYEIDRYNTSGGIAIGKTSINEVNNKISRASYKLFPAPPENYDFGRGDLIYTGVFDGDGNILKETNIENDYKIDKVGRIGGVTSARIDTDDRSLYTYYSIKSGHLSQKVIEDIDHFENGDQGIKTAMEYSSNYPYSQSSISIEEISTSEVISNRTFTYASDLLCLENNTCYEDYIQDSIQYATVFYAAIEDCKQGTSSCAFSLDDYCPYYNYIIFKSDINEARKQMKDCLASSTEARNTCISGKAGSSTAIEKIASLNKQHREGTPIETTQRKRGQFAKAFYMDFDDQFRINKIYDQFGVEGRTFNDLQVSGSNLIVDPNYELAQSIKYEGDRIVEIKGRDGVVTAFLWKDVPGNFKDHPIAKVVGAPYNSVNSIYTANPDLDALRLHPYLADAQVYTYVFEQGKGLIKETDPNGQEVEYKYDDLRRLSIIFKEEKAIKKFDYRYPSN